MIDNSQFRRILARNVALPLGVGIVSAAVFVGIIVYLISVLSWVEHSQRVIGDANQVSKLSAEMETGMRGFLISGDESFLAPYQLAKPRIESEIAALANEVRDNPVQVSRLRKVQAAQKLWEDFASEMIAVRRQGGDYVPMVQSGRGKSLTDEVRRQFAAFLDVEQRLLQERSDSSRNVTGWSVGLFLLFSLSVAGMLAIFGRRELVALSTSYTNAIDQQRAHTDLLEDQGWLRTGQSELAMKMAGHHAMAQMTQATLDHVARYVDGMVAALYVREDGGALRRTATYGFSESWAGQQQIFKPGESLLGQAVREDRAIVVDELPADYIKVSSGLGRSAPRQLLIAPFRNEGEINGVIEIGFLHPTGRREHDFLALVGDGIGAGVAAARYRQRLQESLAETQQLNEELQVQQEELRTANEELEEQSRVLEESRSNLENQQAELEQTNDQLSEQALSLDSKNVALHEAQDQLRQRALDLERASRYKSEFLANMSHELRTPLNSSLILAKLLSDNVNGNLSDEQVRFAQTIYSAGNDLLHLINDILDISKVEAGKLELVLESLPLRRVVDNLASTFEPMALQKQLSFTVQVDPSVPATVWTDRQRLEQILKNLLSNAVKFTDSGAVSLKVSSTPGGPVRFDIHDSGIGIAPEQQQKIFDAFHQADGTTSRRFGGTGLGLSISRDLSALLGGEISVASTPGTGSTFTLVLPRTCPAEAEAIVAEPAPQLVVRAAPAPAAATQVAIASFDDDRATPAADATRSVLVIEDDPAFAGILFQLAHEMGYRCLVGMTGAEGLQLAGQHMPDAILLDMRLPDRSGLSVLQLLKENPQTRHIPVHVVSSNDNGGEALSLGAIGYALKPATREDLEAVFHKLEEKFTQKIKRILLVEDDVRQRESVVALIADSDVEIAAVGSGEEALALLRAEVFDCMIIDLKLPDMQGDELLERMSAEDLCSFPPVIVYTGRNLTRAEEHDLLKYSRSIIIKGARSPERLLDEVTLFLHKVEAKLSTERQGMLKTVRGRDRVFEGRTILLVDDDVRNVFALTSALEQRGAKVEIGRNGFEAISKLDEVAAIDLVLMDIMMPGMDGLEAMRRIRADGRYPRLPIIAITAKAMKDDQEQCLAAGANDYLAKPIDLTRLYSLLRVWMPNLDRI
ncbi:two-component system sensor histidine kinase/response regulator [Massilia eurypsychrophila]|uniref:Virulence sensor protein BvgS n=1 Tax=Massilia eurypsychrophila TaxID=1485217 RepID=A0A2G8TC80_9BURK|nr:response regulator [Massilia eurypsychrophila]PIL43665.1 two-component system sensor histidine kinase/response regulator [Massilia eurypsychrophila]